MSDITLHAELLLPIISIPDRFIPGIHDDPLYLVFPDIPRALDETCYGIQKGFIGSDEVLITYLLFIYLIFIYFFIYYFIYLLIYLLI
jgi:hypothetical protein